MMGGWKSTGSYITLVPPVAVRWVIDIRPKSGEAAPPEKIPVGKSLFQFGTVIPFIHGKTEEGDYDRPSGQAFRNRLHQGKALRSGNKIPALGCFITIDPGFYIPQQRGHILDFINDYGRGILVQKLIRPGGGGFRVPGIIKRDIMIIREILLKQRGFSYLTRTGKHNNGKCFCQLFQFMGNISFNPRMLISKFYFKIVKLQNLKCRRAVGKNRLGYFKYTLNGSV